MTTDRNHLETAIRVADPTTESLEKANQEREELSEQLTEIWNICGSPNGKTPLQAVRDVVGERASLRHAHDLRKSAAKADASDDQRHSDALDIAWGLIANVSGGDWSLQLPAWENAAHRFREQYIALAGNSGPERAQRELVDLLNSNAPPTPTRESVLSEQLTLARSEIDDLQKALSHAASANLAFNIRVSAEINDLRRRLHNRGVK